MELLERIRTYEDLLQRREDLAQQTKDNNKAIEEARRAVTDLMADGEMERIGVGGYNYALTEKCCFNKRGGVDEELFETLRDDGLGDIIRPTVNANTLQAVLRDLTEKNGGELPPQYRELVSEYRYFDISRRKASL